MHTNGVVEKSEWTMDAKNLSPVASDVQHLLLAAINFVNAAVVVAAAFMIASLKFIKIRISHVAHLLCNW